METNEIMVNDDVIETTEEIANASSGKGFMMAAGIGLAVVIGVTAYKYVAKPMLAKYKAEKEPQVVDVDCEEVEPEDCRVKDEPDEKKD